MVFLTIYPFISYHSFNKYITDAIKVILRQFAHYCKPFAFLSVFYILSLLLYFLNYLPPLYLVFLQAWRATISPWQKTSNKVIEFIFTVLFKWWYISFAVLDNTPWTLLLCLLIKVLWMLNLFMFYLSTYITIVFGRNWHRTSYCTIHDLLIP